LWKSIGSLLGDLLSTGQAVNVFEAQGRQLNVAGADELLEDGPLPTIVAIGARDDRDAMRFLEKFKTNSDVEDCYVAPPRDVLSRKSGVLRNLAASLTKSHWGMEMVRRARAGGARQGDRGEGRPLHRRHRLALQWARVAPSLAGVEVSEVGDVALSRQTRGAIGGRRAEGGEDALPQLGLQYALLTYGGGFLVSDAHLNRVLRVTLDGEISVLIAFNNIVPTGLEVRGNMVYMTEAGPDPHLPQDGKVVLFGPRSPTPTELASDTPSSLTWNLAVAVSAVTGSTLATPRTPSVPKIFFCSVTALIETLV
jgi:hypothetical protein